MADVILSDVSLLQVAGRDLYATVGEDYMVNGLEKLAQKFMIELLTSKGSVAFNTNRGCKFLSTLHSKNMYSEFDVRMAFATALVDIRFNLKASESTTTPSTEKFQTASLQRILVADSYLILKIYIYNVLSKFANLVIGIGTEVTN